MSAVALALVIGLTAACSSDSDSDDAADTAPAATASAAPGASTTAPSGDTVTIQSSRFGPTDISVAVGDTVTFTNVDPFAHTVTSRDDSAISFDSGNLGEDETFDVEITEAGTFDYFCQIHPTMRATITAG